MPAAYSAVHDMLTNPTYAGAYAFGRRQSQRRIGDDGRARVSSVAMPRERWQTLIFDITRATSRGISMSRSSPRSPATLPPRARSGAAREGQALLQGLLRCGRCGRRMHSAYSGARSREGWARRYYCDPREGEIGQQQRRRARMPRARRAPARRGGAGARSSACSSPRRSPRPPGRWPTKRPARPPACGRSRLAVERCALRGRARPPPVRRLRAREPAGGAHAGGQLGEGAARARARRGRAGRPARQAHQPADQPRSSSGFSARGADLRAIFDAPTTSQRDRKLLLRALIPEIVRDRRARRRHDRRRRSPGRAAPSTSLAPLVLRRRGQTYPRTPEETVALVRRLAAHYDDQTIADVLARQKRRTATGLRFTKHRVDATCAGAHGIPAFTPASRTQAPTASWSRVRQAAARELDVTPANRLPVAARRLHHRRAAHPSAHPGESASTPSCAQRSQKTPPTAGCRSTRPPARSESSARPCYIESNAASWPPCTSAAANAKAYESRSNPNTLDCLTHRDERRRNVYVRHCHAPAARPRANRCRIAAARRPRRRATPTARAAT